MFRRLFAFRRPISTTPGRFCRRPRLEVLEDRLALAQILHWGGAGADSNMSNAANYVENRVLNAGDTIILDGLNGVNAQKGAVADPALANNLASIQLASSYTGSLTVNTNLTVGAFSQAGQQATISTNSILKASSVLLAGGILGGDGEFDVVGTVQNPGSLYLTGTSIIGVKTFGIDANSNMVIQAKVNLDGITLNNQGTMTWVSGQIDRTVNVRAGAEEQIKNTGTFAISPPGTTNTLSMDGDLIIANQGRFVAALPAGATCELDATVYNGVGGGAPQNPFEVSSGTLILKNFGTDISSAPITVDANATLDLSESATMELNQGASFAGTGTLSVATNVALQANCTVQVQPLIELQAQGVLSGPGTLNASSMAIIAGNFKDVTVTVSNAAMFEGSFSLTNNAAIEVLSVGTWSTGTITLAASEIYNTGTFTITGGNTITGDAQSLFENSGGGTVTKTAGAATKFNVPVSTGGTFTFNGLVIGFQQGLSQTGGLIDLGGGTLDLTPAVGAIPQTYTLSGGTLSGNGNISNGNLVNVSGKVELLAGKTLTLNTGNYTQNAGGILEVDASAANAWGSLAVGGFASLNGTLLVDLIGGYLPPQNYQQIFLTAGA